MYRISAQPIVPEKIDVSAIADQVAGELRVQHSDRDIRFDIQPGMHATADPALVAILFENLLGNAVKYTGRTAVANIGVRELSADAGLALFEVDDNGAGFDPADAERIFRPLTRVHDPEEFPGTGLGLASVARIVELHGGSIHAAGARGVGATFTFSLPA